MPIFELQTPDGRTFEVDAADMQSAAGALGAPEQQASVNTAAKSGPDSFSNAAIMKDVGRQSLQGLKNAATGLAGLPGDLANLAGDAAAGWAGILGRPQMAEAAKAAGSRIAGTALNPASLIYGNQTSGDLNNMAADVMGPDVNAQTWQGRLAGNTAEMAAGAIGPGGPVRKIAQVALPGIASFAAGEATEGSTARPWAKAGAAFTGGVGAGIGSTRQAVNAALKQAPFKTQKQANTATNAVYDTIRSLGVTYNADDFGRMAGQLGKKLTDKGLMEVDAPRTWARINMILDGAKTGKAPSWDEINSMKSNMGELMRTVERGEKKAASIVYNSLDNLEKTAGITSTSGISKSDLLALSNKARDFALRNIKAKEFAKREGKASTYIEGIESGLRRSTANMLRSKYGETLFKNPDERRVLENVTAGSTPRKMLGAFGKLGFDPTRLGNMNSVIPAIGLAGAGGYGYGTGDWENAGRAAAIVGAGSLAKMGARKLTERDARRAMAIILAGPKAQRDMVLAAKGAKRDQMLRAVLAAENASLSVRE